MLSCVLYITSMWLLTTCWTGCLQKADLEPLVQSSILGWGGQVGDGVGIGPPLGNCGLGRVICGVVVHIGHVPNQAVWEAAPRHAHLLAWHELQ